MSLTYSSCPTAGISNRTYFSNKSLISICYIYFIALPRAFFHHSASHHPHFTISMKGNNALSTDKALFHHGYLFISLRKEDFAPKVETFNSGNETFLSRKGRIFLRKESSSLRQESFLLKQNILSLLKKRLSLRQASFLL